MPTDQNFRNHARIVPAYHVGVFVPFFANFIWATYQLIRAFSGQTLMDFLVAIALLLMFFSVRVQVLTVQDRVIRLEMRLRLRELLPAALHSRIHEFTKGQLVAMRFASDEELPALAEKVLRDKIHDRNAIKQAIANWMPDNLRA